MTMKENKLSIFSKTLFGQSWFPAFVLMVVFFIWNSFMVNGFFGRGALHGFVNLYVPLTCLAIGLSVVVIGGGLDISVGALVCLVNVSFVTLIGKGFSLFEAIICVMVVALVFGMLNGFVVTFFRINPLLVTFATTSMASGLALWIMPRADGYGNSDYIDWYSSGTVLGIPSSLYFVIIPIVVWFIMKNTPLGIWLYAVGKDERKAYFSSIRSSMVKFFSYVFCSSMAGLGAIALSGNIGGGDPLVGMSMTMNAVAAVVIGGVSLAGGEGDVLGSVFSVMFLGMVIYTVLGANIPIIYQDLVTSLIILVGVIGMSIFKMYRTAHKNKRRAMGGERA
ncbi:sugar ABC transporter permease [Synergistales bacterium]|nr:sugar ABC transporter permease [Synergistales bacterium]